MLNNVQYIQKNRFISQTLILFSENETATSPKKQKDTDSSPDKSSKYAFCW